MLTTYVPEWTQKIMGLVAKLAPDNTYLAGGTALTLHLGHRHSYDLDMYCQEKFDEKLLIASFQKNIPHFEQSRVDWQTIMGKSKDTEISLFLYEYPLLEPPTNFSGLPVASIIDIACMKVEAIAGRGLKRDFFDLYSICQHKNWNLSFVLSKTKVKFQRNREDLPFLIKALTYFVDAETRPERAKIVDQDWEKVKAFFEKEAPQAVRELLES